MCHIRNPFDRGSHRACLNPKHKDGAHEHQTGINQFEVGPLEVPRVTRSALSLRHVSKRKAVAVESFQGSSCIFHFFQEVNSQQWRCRLLFRRCLAFDAWPRRKCAARLTQLDKTPLGQRRGTCSRPGKTTTHPRSLLLGPGLGPFFDTQKRGGGFRLPHAVIRKSAIQVSTDAPLSKKYMLGSL